jgi:hypothetical protein
MRRIERQLLYFGEVVLGVPVEDDFSHGNERVLCVQPHFGHVEGVVRRGGACSGVMIWMEKVQEG